MATKQEERQIVARASVAASGGEYNGDLILALRSATGLMSGTINELMLAALRAYFGISTGGLAELQARFARAQGVSGWSELGEGLGNLFAQPSGTYYWNEDFSAGTMATFSLTRASQAEYRGANGYMALAAIDAPRYHHNTSATRLGLLLEGAATNLVLYSDDLSSTTYWARTNLTPTENAGADEYNETSAATMTENVNAAAQAHNTNTTSSYSPTLLSDEVYTVRVRQKAGTRGFGMVQQVTKANASLVGRINLSTRAMATAGGTVTASGASDLGNSWVEYYIAVDANHGATTTKTYTGNATSTASHSYAGNGSTTYISRISVEKGYRPTSFPVDSNGAAVTRAADVVSATVALPVIGVHFQVKFIANTDPTERTLLYTGPIEIGHDDSSIFVRINGTNELRYYSSGLTEGQTYQVDFYHANSPAQVPAELYVDGQLEDSSNLYPWTQNIVHGGTVYLGASLDEDGALHKGCNEVIVSTFAEAV